MSSFDEATQCTPCPINTKIFLFKNVFTLENNFHWAQHAVTTMKQRGEITFLFASTCIQGCLQGHNWRKNRKPLISVFFKKKKWGEVERTRRNLEAQILYLPKPSYIVRNPCDVIIGMCRVLTRTRKTRTRATFWHTRQSRESRG